MSPAPSQSRGRPGIIPAVALALIIVCAAVVAVQAASVISTIMHPSPDASRQLADQKQRAEAYSKSVDAQLSQISGRSMFVLPPKPPPEPKPKPASTPSVKRDPGPPPPPSSYGGPKIIAMMGNTVWFEGGDRVSIDGEHDGVTVIGTSPPWTARLKWKGVEFDVKLFERTTPKFLVKPGGSAHEAEADPAEEASPEPSADTPDAEAPDRDESLSPGDADPPADPAVEPVGSGDGASEVPPSEDSNGEADPETSPAPGDDDDTEPATPAA